MNKFYLLLAAIHFCGMAWAEFVTDLNHGWRLTVGPQFNFNASGRLGVKQGAMPIPSSSALSSRAAAKASGDAIALRSGRMAFPNGAFIDPDDAAGISGETWNWHIPAGQLRNNSMSFSHAYSEQSTSYDAVGGYGRDDCWSVCANFGLERAIWKHGDFGADVGFNFAFFIKDNWFKSSAGGYRRTDVVTEGEYLTDVDFNADIVGDPWSQNPDGSWGAGTYDGPGPVLDLKDGDVAITHRWGSERTRSTSTSSGPFSIRGDLQMYEFQLALKPYYEVADWFMIRGTLGIGVDYRKFDVSMSGLGTDSAHDWDCYMICGLGGLFHWNGFLVGGDFLRKVFDDDLDVDTKYVNGSIGNANWMFRVYFGYEF